jgi:hypothetical protein
MGVGSASIMLVFAVLCLTVFSLISLSVAGNDKALVNEESQLVTSYYEADELAARVLAEIIEADSMPDTMTIHGVSVETGWDSDRGSSISHFSCPISESKALNVEVIIHEDSYDILSWKMKDVGDWAIDESMPVWQGNDDN